MIMSLLALLPDILPMIVPGEVHVTKASDLEAQRAGKDSAMIRQGAVIGKTDKMCATGEKSCCCCLYFLRSICMALRGPTFILQPVGRARICPLTHLFKKNENTVLIAKANCASAVHHHGEQGRRSLRTSVDEFDRETDNRRSQIPSSTPRPARACL